MAHPFICPNCGNRTSELDRNAGFTRNRRGCSKCGFAFLFELLDDYYPAPDAAFFVCDGEGRVTGCGKNSYAFTGVEEEAVDGEALALTGCCGRFCLAAAEAAAVGAASAAAEAQAGAVVATAGAAATSVGSAAAGISAAAAGATVGRVTAG